MKLRAKSRSAQPASRSDARPFIKWFADITIDSISLNPDTVLKTTLTILEAERRALVEVERA